MKSLLGQRLSSRALSDAFTCVAFKPAFVAVANQRHGGESAARIATCGRLSPSKTLHQFGERHGTIIVIDDHV